MNSLFFFFFFWAIADDSTPWFKADKHMLLHHSCLGGTGTKCFQFFSDICLLTVSHLCISQWTHITYATTLKYSLEKQFGGPASYWAQYGKGAYPKPDDLSSVLGIHVVRRIDPWKLSFDLHSTCVCTCTQILNKCKKVLKNLNNLELKYIRPWVGLKLAP